MANAKVLAAVKEAVEGKYYGDHIITLCEKADPEKKYGQNIIDHLHEMAGVLAGYARIHKDAGDEAAAAEEEKKLATVKLAIAAATAAE